MLCSPLPTHYLQLSESVEDLCVSLGSVIMREQKLQGKVGARLDQVRGCSDRNSWGKDCL